MWNQSNTKVRCIKSYVDIEESSPISSLLIYVLLSVCSLFGDFVYFVCFPNHLDIFHQTWKRKAVKQV